MKKYAIRQIVGVGFFLILFLNFISCKRFSTDTIPKHTILFIIDGMACGTLEKIDVPNIVDLKNSGVYYPEVHLILPTHLDKNTDKASENYYPWGCSLPNVPIMTGTIFIGLDSLEQNMIQYSFKNSKTAFIVNDGAYDDLKYGFDIYDRYGSTLNDQFDYKGVIEDVKKIIINENPQFLRIHLQGTGTAGYFDRDSGTNIWENESKYRYEMQRADSVLGDFIKWLKSNKKWNESVMVVMGDHGQNDEGWHAPYLGKANKQPVIFAGKNIKKGKVFEYAESIDIAPTIAFLNKVEAPVYNLGRELREIKVGESDKISPERKIERLNELLLKHHNLLNQNTTNENPEFMKINQSFLTIETIGNWHHYFSNINELIKHQENVLSRLEEKSSK